MPEKRNTVERGINRLKRLRAVAARCVKRGDVVLGADAAAALIIRLRT
ncbi:hypothetical protein AB0E96_32895 [Kitasatospora sp. NPDC036755]